MLLEAQRITYRDGSRALRKCLTRDCVRAMSSRVFSSLSPCTGLRGNRSGSGQNHYSGCLGGCQSCTWPGARVRFDHKILGFMPGYLLLLVCRRAGLEYYCRRIQAHLVFRQSPDWTCIRGCGEQWTRARSASATERRFSPAHCTPCSVSLDVDRIAKDPSSLSPGEPSIHLHPVDTRLVAQQYQMTIHCLGHELPIPQETQTGRLRN